MVKRPRRQLPRLERLLIDVDVRATALDYFRAVGFDAQLATRTQANIQSDRSLVAFARKYHRILVCHDKHKRPERHKLEVRKEIYQYGGQVIQISGDCEESEITSLGKVLANRHKWLDFFKANDGIVTVYDNQEMKKENREALYFQIEHISRRGKGTFKLDASLSVAARAPRKPRAKPRPQTISSQQLVQIDAQHQSDWGRLTRINDPSSGA